MLPEIIDPRLLWPILISQASFGVAYALILHFFRKKLRRWTAFMVVGGVLATLAGVLAFDAKWFLLVLLMFTCTGIPMIVGDMVRVNEEDEETRAAIQEES